MSSHDNHIVSHNSKNTNEFLLSSRNGEISIISYLKLKMLLFFTLKIYVMVACFHGSKRNFFMLNSFAHRSLLFGSANSAYCITNHWIVHCQIEWPP